MVSWVVFLVLGLGGAGTPAAASGAVEGSW